MLFELAQADAYAGEFEMSPPAYVKKFNHANRYYPDTIGKYTDDTQMSLAIAEFMLEDRPWTLEGVADKIIECFKRDQRSGYSGGFHNLLKSSSSGRDLLEKIHRNGRETCGSIIRAVPIGYLKNPKEVMDCSFIQSNTTHDAFICGLYSQAVSLSAYYYLNKLGTKEGVVPYLHSFLNNINLDKWDGPVGNKAEEVFRAALTTVLVSESYHEVLINSVNFTGDTDSIAAVAMGLASCSDFFDKTMDPILAKNLENGRYGRDYLMRVDEALKQKFAKG